MLTLLSQRERPAVVAGLTHPSADEKVRPSALFSATPSGQGAGAPV